MLFMECLVVRSTISERVTENNLERLISLGAASGRMASSSPGLHTVCRIFSFSPTCAHAAGDGRAGVLGFGRARADTPRQASRHTSSSLTRGRRSNKRQRSLVKRTTCQHWKHHEGLPADAVSKHVVRG
jgi:hypothetical protein